MVDALEAAEVVEEAVVVARDVFLVEAVNVAEDVVDKDVVGLEILIYHASICNACRKILI